MDLFENIKETMNTQTATYRVAYQEGYARGYEDAKNEMKLAKDLEEGRI